MSVNGWSGLRLSLFSGASARYVIRYGVHNRCRWSCAPTPLSRMVSSVRPARSCSLTAGDLHQFCCRSGILAVGDPLHDGIDRTVAGHAVDLAAVTEAEA